MVHNSHLVPGSRITASRFPSDESFRPYAFVIVPLGWVVNATAAAVEACSRMIPSPGGNTFFGVSNEHP